MHSEEDQVMSHNHPLICASEDIPLKIDASYANEGCNCDSAKEILTTSGMMAVSTYQVKLPVSSVYKINELMMWFMLMTHQMR